MLTWIAVLITVGVVFGVLDAAWLGRIATEFYFDRLGDLKAESMNPVAAAGFYILYVIGVTHFVAYPGVTSEKLWMMIGSAALFGLVCYATWNLTNLAVIREFPLGVVILDMIWGSAATTVAATATYFIVRALPFVE